MAINRVGLPLDVIERVGQPLGCGGLRPALRDSPITLGRAKLGGEILLAADARARHPRIEKIWAKAHHDRDVGQKRDRLFQPALADEAPRTNDIGHHVDRQRLSHGRAPLESLPNYARYYSAATWELAPIRATKVLRLSLGLSAARVIIGLMVWRPRSDETMVRISTLAIRRATTCTLRRSVSVKAARIDPSCSRQAKSP